ncbi:MAG: outer membrane beta-barrel protein [Kofleriaceae bacterium]
MGTRAWLFATLLVSAGSAYAQAPGDNWDEGGGAPGMVQPQQVFVPPDPCNCIANVMENRWAIGLSMGTFGVSPDEGYADTANFDIGQLALRFRATPHLEIEVALGGGHQNYQGNQTDLAVRIAELNLRYRFAIHQHWNWWLMAGIGGASMAPDGASDQTVNDNERPLYQFGVGLEHRWTQFALQAELKATALGPAQNNSSTDYMPYYDSNDTYSGGSFTIGAGYYF